MNHALHLELLSDTTFATRSADLDIDIEVTHDQLGLPYAPGTTVKRLVADTWRAMAPRFPGNLTAAGRELFGEEGAIDTSSLLGVADATFDTDTVAGVRYAQESGWIRPAETLSLLTTVRSQTAVDPTTGAPLDHSLRRRRATLRQTVLIADLVWVAEPTVDHLQVLALAALATRHGGNARNRGAGFMRLTIDGDLDHTRRLAGVAP